MHSSGKDAHNSVTMLMNFTMSRQKIMQPPWPSSEFMIQILLHLLKLFLRVVIFAGRSSELAAAVGRATLEDPTERSMTINA